MIRLGGLVSQKAFGKFEMGKVISNPFATAFVNEAEGSEDHEVSMANNSLDTIIKMATELKAKMGENEKDIPAWIQDHITNAENFISQASSNYHEYGTDESINEEPAKSTGEKIQNLNNRIKALKDKMAATKSSEQKNLIQQRLKNALQTLSNYKKQNIVKEDSPCWKGYKQVGMKDKGGKQVPNCVPNESVIKEAGVPKMYVKYMAVQKKIKELEEKQKVMASKYFAEKELNKKNKMLQDLKKGTQQLASYRRNLASIEDKYLNNLYDDGDIQKAGRAAARDMNMAYGNPYNSDFD
jgi:hypothetical protein